MPENKNSNLDLVPPTAVLRERLARVLNEERILRQTLRAATARDEERANRLRNHLPEDRRQS